MWWTWKRSVVLLPANIKLVTRKSIFIFGLGSFLFRWLDGVLFARLLKCGAWYGAVMVDGIAWLDGGMVEMWLWCLMV